MLMEGFVSSPSPIGFLPTRHQQQKLPRDETKLEIENVYGEGGRGDGKVTH